MDERGVQERLADRLRELGLEVEIQPGGRCLHGRLPFTGDPLLTPGGPFALAAVEFASVGGHRIKCLRPAALFQLPLISIGGCRVAAEIEARIRAAWIDHMARLRCARETLDDAGVAAEFDWNQLHNSTLLNCPTDIVLTFVDYLSILNRDARRYEQLTTDTIRFIEEVERVSGVPASLISTRFHHRNIIDRRSW